MKIFFTRRFFLIFTIFIATFSAKADDPSGEKRDYASNVTIVRDQWGVPHIYGKTDADAAYGLAWAHAEDDFKTIQETFLAAKQMLGVIKGKEGAVIDFFAHAIGTEKLLEERFKSFAPDFIKYLAGYVAGLNDFAAAFPEKQLSK